MRVRHIVMILVCAPIALITLGCSVAEMPINTEENRVIITDRTGREWDVTHARDVYDMNPDFYNYGLGIGAIQSVDNPTIIKEGELGYPTPDSQMPIFGVNHNGEQRAYSINDLARHEVFNDRYPGKSEQYVAVTF